MTSTTRQMAGRGLLVGLIGYASVAVFYAVFDILNTHGVLHTANLLAMTFFRRLQNVDEMAMSGLVDLEAIIRHNVLHMMVALTVGLIVVGLIEDAIRNPNKARFVFFTLGLGFFVTVALFTFLTEPIRTYIPIWTIIGANALSAAVAGLYLLRIYPGLWSVFDGPAPASTPANPNS